MRTNIKYNETMKKNSFLVICFVLMFVSCSSEDGISSSCYGVKITHISDEGYGGGEIVSVPDGSTIVKGDEIVFPANNLNLKNVSSGDVIYVHVINAEGTMITDPVSIWRMRYMCEVEPCSK